MIRTFLVASSLILSLAQTATANPIADVICEPTERMTKKLSQALMSERQAMGLRGPEQVVEVWTDQAGDWTMVITYASGQSCIVAMGEAWMEAAKRDPA